MQVSPDGVVSAGRHDVRGPRELPASADLARLLPSVFQGEAKSAVVAISPLRYDARRRQVLLTKRLLVRLLFTARETGESGRGSRGRRQRPQPEATANGEVLARLYTQGRGLYGVSFEQLFPGRSRGLAASQLRLERQGEARGFHLEPRADTFGPGGVLYFHADAVESIRKAYEHHDPYHPRPIWENFRGLFDAINKGNAALGIHAYNGGLFAEDAVLDSMQVSDEVCGYFRDLGSYDYRPPYLATGEGHFIDVDILGHIFEQSITDLEKLRNELDGLAEPVGAEKHKTRRKKEGAFYTPSFITRYIVEQALGGVLRDRFEALRAAQQQGAKGAAKTALADPGVYELDKLTKPAKAALVKFWEAWQDELTTIRLLDPACGSGAFLIQAFDQLHATYQQSNDRLAELRGHRTLFDLDKRILENNLYGVDLNEEAIEIVLKAIENAGYKPGDDMVIAIDAAGNIILEFNSEGMYRASKKSDGKFEVKIYK
jgi:hypothetical protein